MMEKVPFGMKFRIEWNDCRTHEGRGIISSFLKSLKYAFTTNVRWDTRTE